MLHKSDVIAIFILGILLIKLAATRELNLLIHPNYFILVIFTGISLLSLAIFQGWQLFKNNGYSGSSKSSQINAQHITFLPQGWGSKLLIITAILGLVISPRALSSKTAIKRGISESLPLTKVEPQSFRANIASEERSLIEWIRTFNAYPEPDAYLGQKAKVEGFVVHLKHLPDNYFLISRFVITCCAVDAYPVGILVKLINQTRAAYPPDTWLQIEGKMISESLEVDANNTQENSKNKRQVVLSATSVKKIPIPVNPYNTNS